MTIAERLGIGVIDTGGNGEIANGLVRIGFSSHPAGIKYSA